MAQQLQNITIGSPGFFGLNTEDAIVGQDPNFASVADNCVIDRYGRLGARKGFSKITAYGEAEIGTAKVNRIHFFEDEEGNTALFGAGNNKILEFTETDDPYDTITDVTPALYTITSDNWKFTHFGNEIYATQRGYEPLYYTNAAGWDTAGASVPKGQVSAAEFGRLWIADLTDNKSTLYWSDLLDGSNFTGGSSGSIDVSESWPTGYDEITGIAAHNGRLIVFGRSCILVYTGAESPATMSLEDTIENVGCFSQHSIQGTGTDLYFLGDMGVRSLQRTITENSFPVGYVSDNVRSDLNVLLSAESRDSIDALYSPENAFYLLHLRESGVVYCFDVRSNIDMNQKRVTRWPTSQFWCMFRVVSERTIYVGNGEGLGKYFGFTDNGESYQFAYDSPILTFGDSARLKILKRIRPVMLGGANVDAQIRWSYGFSGLFQSASVRLISGSPAEYGIGEYGIDEFADGTYLTDAPVNTTGNGADVTVGIRVDIDGEPFSLQEISVQTLIGRLI